MDCLLPNAPAPTSPLTGEASEACERSELAQLGGGAVRHLLVQP